MSMQSMRLADACSGALVGLRAGIEASIDVMLATDEYEEKDSRPTKWAERVIRKLIAYVLRIDVSDVMVFVHRAGAKISITVSDEDAIVEAVNGQDGARTVVSMVNR